MLNTKKYKKPAKTGKSSPLTHEKISSTLSTLVNRQVVVQTVDGKEWIGQLCSFDSGESFSVTLKNATSKKDSIENLVLNIKDIVCVDICNVEIKKKSPFAPHAERKFQTDSEISKKPSGQKPLQAWTSKTSDMQSLEEYSGGVTHWDQFATNEKLFGITPKFDESHYTTILDKNSSSYKRNEVYATKLASEILSGSSTNVHVAEERGSIDDSGMDEEDRFSGVVRDTAKRSVDSLKPADSLKSVDPQIVTHVVQEFKRFSTNEGNVSAQRKREQKQKAIGTLKHFSNEYKTSEAKEATTQPVAKSESKKHDTKEEPKHPEMRAAPKPEIKSMLNVNAKEFKPASASIQKSFVPKERASFTDNRAAIRPESFRQALLKSIVNMSDFDFCWDFTVSSSYRQLFPF